MVQRKVNMPNEDPETRNFKLPSAGKEHLFQVVDVFTEDDEIGQKLGLNNDVIAVKLEVANEGEELGRNMIHRVSLDSNWSGFFMTRIFLKALNEPHKGEVEIDSDSWVGKQFLATVIYNEGKNGKIYANIDFDCEVRLKEPTTAEEIWNEA